MSQNNGGHREGTGNPAHHQHYQNHLRQDFVDEVDTPTSTSVRDPSQKDFRVLRCFCGCTQLQYDQVSSYLMMDAKGIVSNEESKKLLKTFLKIGHLSDKSNAMILLECTEFCDKILADLDSHQDYMDDLLSICTYHWEQKIEKACDAASENEVNRQLKEVLESLKEDCLRNIEADHDFERFRNELRRKIGK